MSVKIEVPFSRNEKEYIKSSHNINRSFLFSASQQVKVRLKAMKHTNREVRSLDERWVFRRRVMFTHLN